MNTQEEIQERITNRLTIEANKLEGGFAQDIIGSTSFELANIYQTDIVNLIDRAFVLTAKGDDLDKLGADYGIPRREAQAAIVDLEITGEEFSIINQDIKAIYNNLVFTVQEFKKINSSGVALVRAACDTKGIIGNVEANTITQFLTDYQGLKTVTNPKASYDGFDKEDDEIYRQRILDYLADESANCNKAQYQKWAREVIGVQKAVVKSADEGAGAGNVGVYISAIDSTVSEDLLKSVHDYINEKQFINATVVVESLNYIPMDIWAQLKIKEGYTETDIKDEFLIALRQYLPTVEKTVSYFKISELLFDCEGVEDVIDYTLNSGVESVNLGTTDYATIGEVQIVAG